MSQKLTSENFIDIDASPEAVWKALTTPEMITKYLMGTQVTSDWNEGSPISYEGDFKGKHYHDKGVIKKAQPGKIFQSTYWSSAGGKEDKPENYNLVTYTLTKKNDKTTVKLTQDNISSDEEKIHVTENWKMALSKLKEVVEEDVKSLV